MATLGFGEMVCSFFVNFPPMGGSAGFTANPRKLSFSTRRLRRG
jgi:hypothetical protein